MSGRSTAIRAGVAASAVATAVPFVHIGLLTAASLRAHRCERGTSTRFAVLIPAHDEASNIETTLASLAAVDYPTDSYEVVVIADNCTDETADIARRCGVRVLERHDVERRGKGQALHWAIPRVLSDASVQALMVVDADTVVEPSLLARVSWHIEGGADAVQVDYRVRNPASSWRTRLLDIGFTAQHRVRSSGRSALGLSAGLHGNGMAFARDTLETVPYTAFSVVEDIEYSLLLGRSDRRVLACDATHVAGDMPATADDAAPQRSRWEAGQSAVRKRHLGPFFRRAIKHRDRVAAGHAADLSVPPLTTTVAALGVSSALAVLLPSRTAVTATTIAWGCLCGHVATSVARSTDPAASIRALAHIPTYAFWKFRLRATPRWSEQRSGSGAWERSARTAHAAQPLRLVSTESLEGVC